MLFTCEIKIDYRELCKAYSERISDIRRKYNFVGTGYGIAYDGANRINLDLTLIQSEAHSLMIEALQELLLKIDKPRQ